VGRFTASQSAFARTGRFSSPTGPEARHTATRKGSHSFALRRSISSARGICALAAYAEALESRFGAVAESRAFCTRGYAINVPADDPGYLADGQTMAPDLSKLNTVGLANNDAATQAFALIARCQAIGVIPHSSLLEIKERSAVQG
jgi:hypothetical protein